MFKLEDNLTSSHDNTFVPLPSKWESNTGEIELIEETKKSINLVVSDPIFEVFSNGLAQLMKNHASLITMCAQRRVATFFQQLILAYGSGLFFEIGETLSQAESHKLRTLTTPEETPIEVRLDATHTSFIPCLYAYKTSKSTEGVIFLQDTEAYRLWNSTIGIDRFFNRSVDKTLDNALIPIAINLLNRVAKKKIRPEEGLKEFITQFLLKVSAACEKTEREKSNAVKKKQASKLTPEKEKLLRVKIEKIRAKIIALQIYEKEARSIQKALKVNTRAFQVLLNFEIYPSESPTSNQILFEIRYRAIQYHFAKQQEILGWIHGVREIIFSQAGLKEKNQRIMHELLAEKVTSEDRLRVCKLFNLPFRKAKSKEAKQEAQELVATMEMVRQTTLVLSWEPVIKNPKTRLANQLVEAKEGQRRGKILRQLRKMRGWTREELLQEMPEEAGMTKEKIQQYEREEKKMSALTAIKFCDAMRVAYTRNTQHPVEEILARMANQLSEAMKDARDQEREGRGETLRRLRKMRGWTREDLLQQIPEEAAMTKEKIQDYERGEVAMGNRSAAILSKALNVDPTLFRPQFYYA
ncbi:MAG: hypothetical protein JSS10_08265 [Verrucomicrobia bacterium]|nr:hypothetical protein [Verrucomicrobiota bacterium]